MLKVAWTRAHLMLYLRMLLLLWTRMESSHGLGPLERLR